MPACVASRRAVATKSRTARSVEFVRWLDAVEAKHAAILAALRARGGRPGLWSAWQEREFAEAWKTYRELAQHAATEGVAVAAGWA